MTGEAMLPMAYLSTSSIISSYEIDPKWQRKFTAIWCSAFGLAVLLSSPRLIRSFRSGKGLSGAWGIRESDSTASGYTLMKAEVIPLRRRQQVVSEALSPVFSMLWWTPPGVELSLGQSTVLFLLVQFLPDAHSDGQSFWSSAISWLSFFAWC